jgi:rhamnose transport system permease protein
LGVIPVAFIFLILLFAFFWFMIHKSSYGRLLYAAGNSRKALYFSGYSVRKVILSTYAIAGLMAGIGALLFIGQYESARSDNASSILLFVVACVCLGGFSLSGGKGNVIGLILSLFFLGTIMNGMGLANIQGPVQTLVIGLILIITILIPAIGKSFFEWRSNSNRITGHACD